jgi:Fibrobacter succinogenes major domain (Fib_succ_major).
VLLGENYSIEDVDLRKWNWNYTDFITPSNQNSYQGICPDGWRIPTLGDWTTLLENLGEQYDVYYGNAVPVLYGDDATGFGLTSTIRIKEDDSNGIYFSYQSPYLNTFVMANIPLYSMDLFNSWYVYQGFHLQVPITWHPTIIYADLGYASEWDDTGIPYRQPGAVRCIKN